MSVENTAVTDNLTSAAPLASDDDQLGALWDQIERDNGSARGDDGKFVSPKPVTNQAAAGEAAPAKNEDTPLEGEGGGEAQENADSTPAVSSVPLPANWKGLDAIWSKLAPEDQQTLSKQQSELHSRMSEQGRQISAYRPMHEVLERNRDLYDNKKLPSGEMATPHAAVELLMNAHRKISSNPIAGILEVAEMYGVRDELAATLAGQKPNPQSAPQSAGLTPAQIEERVQAILDNRLSREAALRAADDEISRLSADKPLYSQISEDRMAEFIHMARADLESQGETASNEAVFNLAYDMAVNADATLRAKAAAAQAAASAATPKPAAQTDPKKAVDAKRATSVNVTSTTTGAPRKLSEDDELSALYDELKT